MGWEVGQTPTPAARDLWTGKRCERAEGRSIVLHASTHRWPWATPAGLHGGLALPAAGAGAWPWLRAGGEEVVDVPTVAGLACGRGDGCPVVAGWTGCILSIRQRLRSGWKQNRLRSGTTRQLLPLVQGELAVACVSRRVFSPAFLCVHRGSVAVGCSGSSWLLDESFFSIRFYNKIHPHPPRFPSPPEPKRDLILGSLIKETFL